MKEHRGAARRQDLLQKLCAAEAPVPGAELARQLGVSRQVVVQDVAILRAGGTDILASPHGYLLRNADSTVQNNGVHVPKAERDPFLAMAGIFADDPFMDEVDAYVAAERRRQREEAAVEAGD